MPIHWYKCKNRFCDDFNKDFSMIFERTTDDKEICPRCHGKNIERQTQKELDNKKYTGINL